MSEYQYYEFLAIDRPLSAADKSWLHDISKRAKITATRFANTYNWGDFKGNPEDVLARCFDAHVYDSNFGSRWFMVKLPPDTLDDRVEELYCGDGGAEDIERDDCVILKFEAEDVEDLWDNTDDGTEWMDRLAPLRAELINGDVRCLYLAWLIHVQYESFEPEMVEPPVPPGLGSLSPACKALVEFLDIDATLAEVAAEGSSPLGAADEMAGHWHDSLADLPAKHKDDYLVRFLMGDDPALRRELRQLLRQKMMKHAKAPVESNRRTVGQLIAQWHDREAAE